jgi:hypothetical protein
MRQLLILPLLLFLAGCATTERNAYRVIGSTTALVDGAMHGWGDYVRATALSEKDQEPVKKAYAKYQRSMAAVKVAVYTAKSFPDGQPALETALTLFEVSAGELLALIRTLSAK